MITSYKLKIEGVFCGTKMESFIMRGEGNLNAMKRVLYRFQSISRIIFSELNESEDTVRVHELIPSGDDIVYYFQKEDDIVWGFNNYVDIDITDLADNIFDHLENRIIKKTVGA